MAARQGDFLLLNYTLKVKESGETVETTLDTVAKEAHLHREDTVYAPRFIILGEGSLPKGLEESLVGLEPGKASVVEVPPDKGYGARDPAKMRLVPLRRFREKGLDPIPGKEIEFDGRLAVVRAVGAGRVQVDFNHRLAGRTLVYDVSIEKVLEDEKEKILNIISRRIPEVPSEKFMLDRQNQDLTIDVPEEAFYLSGLQVAKKALTADLQKYFPEIDGISFRETFKRPIPKLEVESTSAAPTSQTQQTAETESEETARTPEPEEMRKRTAVPARKSVRRTSRRRPMAGSESQR